MGLLKGDVLYRVLYVLYRPPSQKPFLNRFSFIGLFKGFLEKSKLIRASEGAKRMNRSKKLPKKGVNKVLGVRGRSWVVVLQWLVVKMFYIFWGKPTDWEMKEQFFEKIMLTFRLSEAQLAKKCEDVFLPGKPSGTG